MSCMQQATSYSELTVVRLEQSRNLLVAHQFAYCVLVCFVNHVIIFLALAKKLMQSVSTVLKSFTKSFRK